MIIATAGHVDHGKTLLVKALTGVDADRLPEEKKRGMTIDLGFAYLPLATGETIGFIDVPGHEHFIHNMLCGVAGIDFALLVVAADDGPKPQTREHLAVLDLLGVGVGSVALTKIDCVPAPRVEIVKNEIASLLAGTTLAGSPVFPVSSVTREGIDNLRSHLANTANICARRSGAGNFRMTVDRCFTIDGAGLVVTGTAVAGLLAAGDPARVLQAGLPVRVRAIHAQHAASKSGAAGQRCALNLAGPGLKSDHHLIRRGDWIVTGGVPPPAVKIDVRLRILKSETRPLQHWTPVHVHLGAADVTGRVAVLEGNAIGPGRSALAQLVLDRPLGALFGDGFVIRDQSAQHTVGGGRVIDVFPPARGRAKAERLTYLRAMENDEHPTALRLLLDVSPFGLNVMQFAANRNLTATEAAVLFEKAALRLVVTAAGTLGFSAAHWNQWRAAILHSLADWHRRSPGTFGPAEDRIFAEGVRLAAEVAVAITAELAQERAIVKGPYGIRLPENIPALNSADAVLWKRISPLLKRTSLRPPTVHEIAAALGEDARKIEALLSRAARLSLVVQVARNRFYLPDALRQLGVMAEMLAAESGNRLITAASFRDRTGIGRNGSIEILDFFERIKMTRRIGDAHRILRPAGEALAAK